MEEIDKMDKIEDTDTIIIDQEDNMIEIMIEKIIDLTSKEDQEKKKDKELGDIKDMQIADNIKDKEMIDIRADKEIKDIKDKEMKAQEMKIQEIMAQEMKIQETNSKKHHLFMLEIWISILMNKL